MRKQLGCLILLACAVTATGQDVAGSCSVEAEQKASTAPKPPGTFDIGALEKTVDPCVDFYQFACGGWRKANPIPADQTRWGRFNELAERNREALHEILEQVKDPADRRSPMEFKGGDHS